MNSVRAHRGVDDIWEFVIRGADTGKCSLSEKMYTSFLSRQTKLFRYKGVRIKLVCVGRGSIADFHPADSRSDVNKTINARRRSSLKTTV